MIYNENYHFFVLFSEKLPLLFLKAPYFTRCHPNVKIWDSFNFLWVYIVIFGQSFAVYMFIILIISTHLVQSESHFSLNESWRVLSLKNSFKMPRRTFHLINKGLKRYAP